MIIDCISDLHGFFPQLSGGDLLLVAGDLTASDSPREEAHFRKWLNVQPYRKKIVVAGNHDGGVCPDLLNALQGCQYLQDESAEFNGLKIWGSPWTPAFGDWHFMKPRGSAIRERWDLIPADTDILVTHGPPLGILDMAERGFGASEKRHVGCEGLRDALKRVRPRLHVFGHIHESYGQMVVESGNSETIYVNAAHVDKHYDPVNPPTRVIL